MVPARTRRSACLGVGLATSAPKRARSCLEAPVDIIISMAQQLVPNVRGHKLFERAQLITLSMLVKRISPPGIASTAPGIGLVRLSISIQEPLFSKHKLVLVIR